MSQYSLSTCDPLVAQREDRRNVVRKIPKLSSQGSVLFEAGTLSTRAGSLEDSPIFESSEEDENSYASPSSESSEDSSYPVTPLSNHHRSRSILGGCVVESPAPSRRGTAEENEISALIPVSKTAFSSPPTPDTPTTPTGRPRPKRKAPPPLLQSTPGVEDGSLETPAPTPTTPSAFSRAFGVLTKAFNR
ncbi:hypothetical protein L227DRAFT_581635 [Lentinus tigrinus ALCF2SS1-6]|uniref:Uncharacterized protein n=1 Tax=Lentinus tigrinus ALCF2SS1-6 TaxID=1328759 RepID=A0A5C2RNB3_9APHY|nr:hypothetical protein L227DRAFT_581635 [Lentinus tigrinus ALCF2SS1-6]